MNSAFEGCVNLGYTAPDSPDLSGVASMRSMFNGAAVFNGAIDDWDVETVNDMSNVFFGAESFNQDIRRWNVEGVTNMRRMFSGAELFNQDIGGWGVSNVVNMFSMFAGANSFNQNIGDWDVGQVRDMADMFSSVTFSTENYDALLSGWSELPSLQSTVQFSAGNSKFCNTGAKGVLVNAPNNWVITDGGLATGCSLDTTAFITTWVTSTVTESITIPTHSESTYNYNVDWGDGMVNFGYTGAATHTYTTAGTYTVSITGDFPRIYFNNEGDKDKIISIDRWGDIAWSSMNSAFEGCVNLGYTAPDSPDLSGVSSMRSMFNGAAVFNGAIDDWDVETVNDMSNVFFGAELFNQDIRRWNVEGVTNMRRMFNDASLFNQDISIWNVEGVTNMRGMFSGASLFNQDISRWNVSKVTSMFSMFAGADSFNQDIGDWDVGQVSDMTDMFSSVTFSIENYDALLSGWSTIDNDESDLQSTVQFSAGNSKFCNTGAKGVLVNAPNNWVITDGGLATGCPLDTTAFITTWVTSTVTESITIPTHSESTYSYNVDWGDGMVNFGYTGAATHTYTATGTYTVSITGDFPRIYFNNEGDKDKIISIDRWGDIAWSSMNSAFEGCVNLGYTATDTPDLSRVSSMAEMFRGANKFNGNIGDWDVGQVRDMSSMFAGADSFNQDIGDWDVGQISDMTDMFSSVTLSIENYDALLSGWSELPSLQSTVQFSAGNSKYCDQESKNILTGTYLWTITDGGQETDILCGIPYVVREIPDQSTVVGTDFSYTFPEDTFSNIDADTLTYTAVIETPSTNWLSFFPENRTFSGIPGFNDIGVTMITVTADDGIDGIATDTFILTVINRVPTVNAGLKDREAFVGVEFSYSIPSDAFSDDDLMFGDTLTYSVTISTTTETNWLSFDSADTFSGTPPSINDIGISTIMVTATDLNGGSTSDTFTVTVVNRVPTVNEGLASTSLFVGADFSYKIPENAFSDGDIMYGDTLTYTANINPQGNWLTFSSETRTFTGRPSLIDIGTSTITVTATDLNGGSVNSSFTVTVPNRPPIQIADLSTQVAVVGQRFSYKIPENAFIDPDDPVDGTLLYSTDETLNWLMFSSATRTFSGTPTSIDPIGISTVPFTVTDLNGGSVNSDFILNIVEFNTPPTLNQALQDQMTYVNRALDYSILENAFSDPDGGSLLYSAEGNPNWFSFDTPTLTFSGTPTDVTDIGISMITVTATDLNGGSTSDTFTVTVINRVPAVNAGFASTIVFVGAEFSYEIPENAFSDGDITFNDTLTYTANINPQGNWLTFSSETRIFTGSPRLIDIGISTITVTAMDLNGGSVNSSFTVTVVNRVPTVNAGFASTIVFVGAEFSYEIPETAFSDGDITFNDTLTYTANINPQGNWLTFSSKTRIFTGRPSLSDIGISTITVTATDRNGGSVNSSFTVTVVNRVPAVNAGFASTIVFVGAEFSYEIPENAFSDDDIMYGDTLTYTANINPQDNWLTFSSETRIFFGRPTITDIGISMIMVTATDLNGGSVNSSFTVTVPNRPPIQIADLTTQVAVIEQRFSYKIPENVFNDPDGGTLLYSAEGNPGWLIFSTETRTFTGRPPSEASTGINTVPFTVTDPNGGSLNSNFILNVVTVNMPPTLNPARPLENRMRYVNQALDYSIPENAFSDPDGGSLLYSAEGNPNWLSFDTPTLTFSGTPTSINYIGISTITVTATDLNGGSTSDTFTVTVINRIPAVNAGFASTSVFVGADFSYEIPENAFSDGDITFNDTLTYTANINPQGNWLTFASETRTFIGRPSLNDIGISTITVTATDLNGGSVNSSFTVTVINRVPAVNAGFASTIVFVGAEFSYEIPENAFSDGDITFNDTLTYTANINPQGNWLTFSSETRTFTGRPTITDIGISTITVTATDLNGGSVNSSFTVTVVNRVPTVNADLASTSVFVGAEFSYEIPETAFSDGDITFNDTLTYTANINPQGNWLTFASETRTFTGRPTITDIGISTITVTATDLNGGSVNSSFTVTVVNRVPAVNEGLRSTSVFVGADFSYEIPENAFSDGDITFNDTLTYTANINPQGNWLTFASETRTFIGRPSLNDIGISTITVTATDRNGGSVNSSFTVTVINRIPAVNAGFESTSVFVGADFSYEIPENAFSDGDITFNDTLTYTANINPQGNWLTFASETRTFTGRPSLNDIGISTITVTATDRNGGSVNSSFTVTVINRVPTVNAGFASTSVFVGAEFSYEIPENAFSDGDITFNDTLTYTANINPQGNWLSFDTPTLTFSGTPTNVSDIGITTITVTATDLNGGSVNSSFTVTVINRVPAVNAGLASTIVFVGNQFSYEIPENAFSDGDITFNDTLTYTANINPQGNWLTFSTETRTFTGRPTITDIGISTIMVAAMDLNGGSVNSSFTVTVINRVPTVNEGLKDREAFVGVGFSYSIPSDAFSDDDITFNDTLTYTANINPQGNWLTFSTETRTFTGRPSLSDIGISTITVTATDLNGGSTSDTFTVTVVNRVPTVNEGLKDREAFVGAEFSYEIPENAFRDDDIAFGDTLTYTANINPQGNWLTFASETRTFTGRPSLSDIGISTITVTAMDLNGGSTSDTFTVTVINRVPTVNAGLASTSVFVGAEFSYEIPENAFRDDDIAFNDTLTYTANINPQGNWLAFASETRTFTGSPRLIDIGISTITVTATDLNGGSVNSSFTVTVVNRVPTVNVGLASTSVFVGTEFSYSIPSNAFSDPDGGSLLYSVEGNPNWLSFNTPTLTFSGTPTDVTDIGITMITVTATDLNGGSVNSSFTVTVVNRVPTVSAGLASTSVFVGAEFSYEIPENAFSDGDITFNDTLTYTANINSQGNWLTFASETRTFTGKPTSTDIGISTITVTATDRNGGSVNSSFTVTVVNRVPTVDAGFESTSVFVGADFSYEIPENAFRDDDIMYGDTLTYTANINPQGNWLTFSSETRTFTGRPSLSDIGISTITVTAIDLNGGSVNSSFTVTVVNRVPAVNAGLASTSVFVGAEFSYEIPETAFSDGDIAFGDTLTYTANINPQDNWLTFSSETRTFTGRPTSTNDIGISTITVTATDLNGGSVNSSFTVTVPNRPPIQIADLSTQVAVVGQRFSYKIPENAFIDPDDPVDGTLSYSTDETLNWLMFSSETRTFSGTPTSTDPIGISTVPFTVTDLNGGSVNSDFILNIVTVNTPPTLNPAQALQDQMTYVNQALNYSILETAFSDPDGGSLLYSAEGNPNWLSFDTPTLTFSGTPTDVTDIGITTITVTATDLNGGSTSDTFTVTVINRVPAVNAGFASTIVFVGAEFSYEIPENAFSDGDITFNDTLTYTANINPQGNWLTFSSETRIFTGSPRLIDIGISTITVTATDLNGGSVNSSFTVTVVNRVPAVNAGFASTIVFVGAEFSYEIPETAFSDGDITFNDTLTYTANINPQGNWLTFSSKTRTFTGRPSLIDIGISTITVTATDLNGGSVNSSFTVTVVNRVPAVNAGFASTIVFVGAEFSYEIPENAFSDDDIMYGDTLTYTANINPQDNWLTFSSETRIFSGSPSLIDIGISMIMVTATDLNGGSVNSSFTVTVPNRPPIQIADLTTQVAVIGQRFSYKIPENAFNDPDGGTLLYSAEGNPGWLIFSTETRTFSGNPPSEASTGINTVPFTVTDLNGGSLNSNFILNVVTVNTPPTLNPARPLEDQMTHVNRALNYSILENAFSDPDGGSLLYSAEGNPNWLSFGTPTLTFSGTPTDVTDIGVTTITVTATDLNGGSVNSSFTLTVFNRPPIQIEDLTTQVAVIAQRFSYKIPENAFIDPDDPVDGTLSYSTDENLNWLMFSTETRTFSGTPTSTDPIGISTVPFTVTDLNGGSVNSDFILNIVTVNTPPTLNQALENQMTYVNRALDYSILETAFSDPDGGSLLYFAEGNPNWLSFDTPTLTFSGTPTDVTDIGITTITVTATDLNGGSTSDTFTVTVINRVPAVNAGLASTIVFVGAEFSYEIPETAFSDGDIAFGDTLTYTANINPQNNWLRFSFSSESRTFSSTPTSTNDIGISTITVTATDLNGGSVNSSFTVTVPNRPPIQIADLTTQVAVVGQRFSYKIPEGAFIDLDDPDDGTLLYSTDETLNWLMFSSATRTFSGTPTSTDPIGISTVPFTVTDLNGGSVNSDFILNVVTVNTPPTLNPAQALQDQMTYVNQALNYSILENAFSDPDGGSLLYSAEGNPNWLSFDTPTLTFSGTPTDVTDIGISTITVTATDLNGGSVSSSFTVTVPNRPPIQIADLTTQVAVVGQRFSYKIPENAFSDPDGGTLLYSAEGSPGWLIFSTETRTFSGTPTSTDPIGISTVPFTVTDLNGGSVNSDFILNIVTVNTPPTLNPAQALENQMTYVNRALDYSILENAFSDPDGGSLLYSAEGNPNWLSFDTPTLTFSGTPTDVTDIGITTITVTATDLNGGSTSDTFTVTVINRVPTVNEGLKDREAFVGENFSYSIPSDAFSDGDIAFGDTLTYTANINSQGNWLTFSSETRTFTGSPRLIDIGISTITVTATDLNGGSVNSSFTVTVPNRPPIQTAGPTTQVAVVGQMFSYKIPEGAFIDPDDPVDGTLLYSTDENLNWLMFSSETRTFSGTPISTDPIGISTVPFTVTDLNGGSVNSDFILNVVTVNTPPMLNQALQDQMTHVNQALNYPIDEPENAFIDPDGGSLLYSAEGNPNWLSFDTPMLIFSGTPPSINDIGISTITVTATDLNGGSTSDTFTVTVGNRIPTVKAGLASTIVFVGEDFSYKIPETAFSDGDIAFGDTLTYTANINPQGNWLTFSSETRTFTGRPSLSDIGISTITVTVTDLNGGSTSDTFTVTVVNRVPTVNAGLESQMIFVGEDFSYEIPETAFSDGDITFNDTLTYTADINPQGNWLTFSSETRTFTGRPSLSDIGISTITVTAMDLNGGSVNSSFTVTVINRIPTVNAGLESQMIFVGEQFSYEIPENAFSDGDIMYGDTLIYTANINPQDNWFTFSSETRTFSGTPTSTDIGISTITVTATDRNGDSAIDTFTLIVNMIDNLIFRIKVFLEGAQ